MPLTALAQFSTTPGSNSDVNNIAVGTGMTVDNTNDAFQNLMALIRASVGLLGQTGADIASAATTNLAAATGFAVNITGTNAIDFFGTVQSGNIMRLRIVNGLTINYNASRILTPGNVNMPLAAGDQVEVMSLGANLWRVTNYFPVGGAAIPTGTVLDFAGATAPTGYLLANGQAVSRTGYPTLFALIGTTFGAGDGSTTFNVPDYRGRTSVGRTTMGASASGRLTGTPAGSGASWDVLGATSGASNQVIAATDLPAHTHTFTTGAESASHTHTGTTGSENIDHTHAIVSPPALVSVASGGGFSNVWQGAVSYISNSGTDSVAHQHNFTTNANGSSHTHSGTTNSTAPSTTPNNLQPTIVMNMIIKT